MATVQVLCPNGRRQNVKITPNSKLLQVLEDVCKKQGFIPAEDYKLVHGRKDLDLSLSFRYANLPNNAKLELQKLEKSRAEENVGIALQLESGQRLQNSFLPGTSLWDILQHWETQSCEHAGKLTVVDDSRTPPTHPVCIYMTEEVVGECALQSTTLRKLGLTAGRAVIRLVHRPVEDSVIAGLIAKADKEKVKEARLREIAARKHAEMQESSSSESQTLVPSGDVRSIPERLETNMDADICDNKETKSEASLSGQEAMEVDTAASVMSVSTGDTSDSNTICDRGQNSVRSQNQDRASGQSSIEQLRSMNIPGVEIFTPDDFNDLPPDQQQLARALAQKMMQRIMGESAQMPSSQNVAAARPRRALPQALPRALPQPQFADFKFPESSKGKSVYSNELSDVDREEFKPCDRETVLFDLDKPVTSSQPGQTDDDLPDDFFEVTDADIRKMMTDLQKNAENVADAPLMTQSMRQARLEERYSKYKKVVIRVQFPDKLVLQGMFRPRETVFAVQKFVKEHLQDKTTPFYLYTTPPKSVLKDRSSTLIEAHLVPATRIYFGCDVAKDHYLSGGVRAEISTREQAEQLAFKSLPSCEPGSSETVGPKSAAATTSRTESSSTRSSSGAKSGEKAPKWLKLGKK
ncbi:tether containing UBX domain for GLUT4-like [Haliotis rubra]|uniref:tether containing UBX domain for GLUT4-like n=1 Tax=Haliotis rubra TaxID=36100 RepID=UPI001EE57C26|nr:tether containing UBX domain for GLUT4-like [Haliotis rubra]